uniref:hypothetical protein n=1 Tax=Borrelia persica TaxID=44448 RepID=UPI000570457D
FIDEHTNVFERQREVLAAIDALVDPKSREAFEASYNKVLRDYKLYVRELFNNVEGGTFDLKFDRDRDRKENYEQRFAVLLDNVRAFNAS